MTSSTRIAEHILGIVVRDPDQREAIVGDLREEWSRYSARVGAARAARWHMRQCLGIAVRYGCMRLLRRKPPVRWIVLAADEPGGGRWQGLTRAHWRPPISSGPTAARRVNDLDRVDGQQPIASLTTLDTMVEERAAGFIFIARALAVVGASSR